MTYEESIRVILAKVSAGEWDGNRQLNFTSEDGDLVHNVEKDGYIKHVGGNRSVTKDGVHYTGKFLLTEKGKDLIEGK